MEHTKTPEKEFGLAGDYYRVRLLTIDEQLPDDLDWRDDILYASPKRYPGKHKVTFRLQLTAYTGKIYEIANLKVKAEAAKRYKKMKSDLNRMTKREFDKTYKLHTYQEREQGKGEAQGPILLDPVARDSMVFMGVRHPDEERQNNCDGD